MRGCAQVSTLASLRKVSPPAVATAARCGPSSPPPCSQHAAAFRENASVDDGAQGAGLPHRHRRGAGRWRGVRCAARRRASAHARQVALSRRRVVYKPKQSFTAFIVQPCHQPRRQSCAHSGSQRRNRMEPSLSTLRSRPRLWRAHTRRLGLHRAAAAPDAQLAIKLNHLANVEVQLAYEHHVAL